MSKRSKAALYLGVALASMNSASAFAQAGAAEPRVSDDASDIIVTARRVEERLQDVPISITVFNQQQLANRNVVSSADLGTYTPSLTIQNRFGSESASFVIRGFTQEGPTSPSVGLYFADVVAPRAQGGTTNGNGAGVGSFFDLQSVQILKGPQGTLFGRNTTGGAILLVPQKPTSRFEGYVEGSVGNYDMRRLQAVVNLPLADWARFRIGVDRNLRDGYLRNRSGIGPKDFEDTNYWAVRASLVLDLTPDLENYTIATFGDSDTNGFYPKITLCNPTPASFVQQILAPMGCAQIARQAARGDGYYDIENGNPRARQHIRDWRVINTTTWQASDTLTIKNIASYASFKQGQTANIFGENFALGPGIPFNYVGLYRRAGGDNSSQWTLTEEFQIQGRDADSRFTYQAGVYYEKSGPIGGFQGTLAPILLSCSNVYAFQCFDPIGAMAGTPVGTVTEASTKQRFRNFGVYAQGTYKISDKLSVTGGIRYTSDRVTGISRSRTIIFPAPNFPVFLCSLNPTLPANDPSVCNSATTVKSSKPTWLIDLDYKPVEDVLLYAKYARGYRQGNVNATSPAFRTWGPEKVDTYELGVKTSFRGAISGYFNIAAFYNDFTDQQIQANTVAIPPNQPVQAIVNAGKSTIKGVEIDASFNLLEGLTVDVGYAYLDTKLKSFVPPPFDTTRYSAIIPTAVVGGPLALSPKNRITLTGTYRLPLPESIGRLSVGATFTHTDKQLASAGSPNGVLPPTDLLNLNVNWNSVGGTPIDLSLFATNVTKEKYPVYVGGSFLSTGFESELLGQPRMYGARIRYRFGS